MKEEADKARAAAQARAAAAQAKRAQEKLEDEQRKIMARARRVESVKQLEEQAKRAAMEKKKASEKKQQQQQQQKKKKAAVAPAKAPVAIASAAAKGGNTKTEESAEWAEMRRLERESNELLELSPAALKGGAKAGLSPEMEFVKRGPKSSPAVAASVDGAAVVAVPERKLSKAEAEKERKELLQGLDAVMQDLQRRADEKKSSMKTAAAAAGTTPAAKAVDKRSFSKAVSPTKATTSSSSPPAKAPAKRGGGADDLTALAKKLTIPKLKSILEENKVKPPSSRAKKEELVQIVADLASKNPAILKK